MANIYKEPNRPGTSPPAAVEQTSGLLNISPIAAERHAQNSDACYQLPVTSYLSDTRDLSRSLATILGNISTPTPTPPHTTFAKNMKTIETPMYIHIHSHTFMYIHIPHMDPGRHPARPGAAPPGAAGRAPDPGPVPARVHKVYVYVCMYMCGYVYIYMKK
jgi:hypothetical protein